MRATIENTTRKMSNIEKALQDYVHEFEGSAVDMYVSIDVNNEYSIFVDCPRDRELACAISKFFSLTKRGFNICFRK